MPGYDFSNTTPEQIQAERAEEARRVTAGYEIVELRAFPDSALRRFELEIKRLQADLTAALNVAEASARQCERLRTACERALAISEDRSFGTWDDVMRLLRAALAPVEEPPE